MSDFTDNGEPTAVQVGANPYNTYGLATQGFVWAAISSVSGNFDGRVKTINRIGPDDTGNVNVTSIRTEDYSGEVNEIHADLTVLSGDVEYRLLTNLDYDNLQQYTDGKIKELSGESSANFDIISAASGGWDNAENVVESASGNWNNATTKIQNTSSNWDSVYSSVNGTSGNWDNATSKIESTSSNWDSTYGSVNTASADWENSTTKVENTSSNWDSVYSTVLATSSKWNDAANKDEWDSVYASVYATSADWENATTKVENASSNWDSVHSSVSSASADWENASTKVENASSNWDSTYSSVNGTSGNWDNSTSKVQSASANWDSVYSSVNSASANWQNATTKVQNASSNWDSVYSSTLSNSADWENASTKVENTSSDWDSVVSSVSSASADWENSTTKVENTSANWDSVYSTVESASAGWKNHVTLKTVPYSENEVLTYYTSSIDNPSVGDALILKKQLIDGSDKYAYSSFEFDGENWKPAAGVYNVDGGAYSAEDVFFTDNLTSTYSIGNIDIGTTGSAVISAKGKNIKQVFNEIFLKEKFPTTTLPTASLSYTGMGAYESGSWASPTYSITYYKGSYTYGPESNANATNYSTVFNGNTYTSQSGSVASLMVTDALSSNTLRMSSSVRYGNDTVVPVTNLGNPYSSVQIKNGSTPVKYSSYITSYRQSFCGGLTSKTGTFNSSLVRNLATKSNKYTPKGSSISMEYKVGDIRAVFAYPSTIGNASEIIDKNGLNANIIDAFIKTVVNVNDASNSNPIPYNVYYKDAAEPNDTANVYTMKI